MIVDIPDLPFKVTDGAIVNRATGMRTPSTPELILDALIYQKLCEISDKLNAPIINITNHPAQSSSEQSTNQAKK